jgi:hypothetical protein
MPVDSRPFFITDVNSEEAMSIESWIENMAVIVTSIHMQCIHVDEEYFYLMS